MAKVRRGCAAYLDQDESSPFISKNSWRKTYSTSPQDSVLIDLEDISCILSQLTGVLVEFGFDIYMPRV